MSMPALQCRHLGHSYREADGRLVILRDVDLSVAPGSTIAITGASGSGKSTLLHMLGGLATPETGEVYVGGENLRTLSHAARGALRNRALGFVYQFHHLLGEFTALENVMLPLLIRQTPRAQAQKQAADLLRRVGLDRRLEHKPAELSGGERQRAAVARAMVTEPACILADEPTGNLDEDNAKHVADLLFELNRERGSSLIIATHDNSLAKRCEQHLRLQAGRLRAA